MKANHLLDSILAPAAEADPVVHIERRYGLDQPDPSTIIHDMITQPGDRAREVILKLIR